MSKVDFQIFVNFVKAVIFFPFVSGIRKSLRVKCIRFYRGNISSVDDVFCKGATKPRQEERVCNVHQCPIWWVRWLCCIITSHNILLNTENKNEIVIYFLLSNWSRSSLLSSSGGKTKKEQLFLCLLHFTQSCRLLEETKRSGLFPSHEKKNLVKEKVKPIIMEILSCSQRQFALLYVW